MRIQFECSINLSQIFKTIRALWFYFSSFLFWLSLVDATFHFLYTQGLGYTQGKCNTALCSLKQECLFHPVFDIQALMVPFSTCLNVAIWCGRGHLSGFEGIILGGETLYFITLYYSLKVYLF